MILIVLVLYLISIFAFLSIDRERKRLCWVDYTLPLFVLASWVMIVSTGYGHQSLSNIVEVPIAWVFTIVLLVMKVFIADKYFPDSKQNSYILVLILFTFVFLLRTFMPFIPE